MVKIQYRDPNHYRYPPDNIGLSKLQYDLLKRRLPLLLDDTERFLFSKLNLTDIRNMAQEDFKDANKLLEITKDMKLTDRICVLSDFDTDGITSAVGIEKSLEILGYTNTTTIINKRTFGTGVTDYCLDALFRSNEFTPIDYIILSDHGSKNEQEYKLIKSKMPNVKIILTDHHTVDGDSYPHSVDVFMSSELLNKASPLSRISGCAVAYLTMLLIARDKYKDLEPLLYLVGLSTVSDVMPLDNYVNRYFVKVGINLMYNNWNTMVKTVLKTDKIKPTDLSFKLIPVINTGNRLDCEDLAYKYVKNDQYAIEELTRRNVVRQMETNKLCSKVVENEATFKNRKTIVCLVNSKYALGGIVAGRVGELYNKPAVIFTKDNLERDIIAGSIRGIIPLLNVVQVLKEIEVNHPGILVRYGGHRNAAGCSIYFKELDNFSNLFEKYTALQLDGYDLTKTIEVDMYLPDTQLHPGLLKALELLEPFGHCWEAPVFKTNLRLSVAVPIGDKSKLVFKTSYGSTIDGYYRGTRDSIQHLIGEMISVIYSVDTYSRSGVPTMSLSVLALQELDHG